MQEISGNLWNFHKAGEVVAITTNGSVRHDGCAVMGRGVAREAAVLFPALPSAIGRVIRERGSHVWLFARSRIFTFPVKHQWMQQADIKLIQTSARELAEKLTAIQDWMATACINPHEPAMSTVYLVRPGCGNGGLLWENVKPVIAPILDDRFIIVEKTHETRPR